MRIASRRAVGALVIGRFGADERRLVHWLIHSKGVLDWGEIHDALGRDRRNPKLYAARAGLIETNVIAQAEDGTYRVNEPDQWVDRLDEAAAVLVNRATRDGEARIEPAKSAEPEQRKPARKEPIPARYRDKEYMDWLRKTSESIAAHEAKPVRPPSYVELEVQVETVHGPDARGDFIRRKAEFREAFGPDETDYVKAAIRWSMTYPTRPRNPIAMIKSKALEYKGAGKIPTALAGETTPLVPWGMKASQRAEIRTNGQPDVAPTDEIESTRRKWEPIETRAGWGGARPYA